MPLVGWMFIKVFSNTEGRGLRMGWWQACEGGVLWDPALDFLDELEAISLWFQKPSALPDRVQASIVGLYCEGLGREPTEEDVTGLRQFQNASDAGCAVRFLEVWGIVPLNNPIL